MSPRQAHTRLGIKVKHLFCAPVLVYSAGCAARWDASAPLTATAIT